MEFINLKAQYECYKGDIDRAMQDVLNSSQFIMGKAVSDLESAMSVYVGSKHAIGCSSGTDALILALLALDIKSGDEVITSPFSFIASVEAIMLLGAK
ncbi:DegT/DnrJ/EryC1/StrS family aminotransferase, partial [Helicobacter typhlonius]